MGSNTTRLDFLRNISNNNIKELMCYYFDQNMALYNLIYENINDVDVSCDISNGIHFNIKSKENIESKVLNLGVKNEDTVFCYGKTYHIQLNASRNEIGLQFIEVVG